MKNFSFELKKVNNIVLKNEQIFLWIYEMTI